MGQHKRIFTVSAFHANAGPHYFTAVLPKCGILERVWVESNRPIDFATEFRLRLNATEQLFMVSARMAWLLRPTEDRYLVELPVSVSANDVQLCLQTRYAEAAIDIMLAPQGAWQAQVFKVVTQTLDVAPPKQRAS